MPNEELVRRVAEALAKIPPQRIAQRVTAAIEAALWDGRVPFSPLEARDAAVQALSEAP